ncbi:MAG: UbiA family prenyltransferase [Prosthecobacter sp.]|nr:UbiA family prenyltransferase [Prosthecobacter sp.]
MLRPWLELARASNLPTVWTNVTAAWLLAGGGWQDWRLGWLVLAGSLLYTGGMILNDAADVKFDREHRQERPIPSGRVSVAAAWTVGLGMMVAGCWLGMGVAGASAWITLALAAAILFYDLYHKPWAGAVWVMGSCRVLLYLMAASHWGANSMVWAGAVALGFYIVGLTMVARMEGKGGASSLAAAVFAKGLLYAPGIVAVALMVTSGSLRPVMILGDLRPLAPLLLVFVFAAMVVFATRLMRQGGPAIGQAVGILLAGIPIVDALAVSRISFPLALGFVALAPLLRFWQRWIAAT